jgi:phytoene dehydrogenase-like protein
MTSFDTIVIGGGHNGLVCAALLAKGGRKVLVLEAASEVGGPARTEEFYPGFRASTAHLLNRLHPDVIKALELEKHGLTFSKTEFAPSVALSRDGNPLTLHGAYGETLTGTTASEQSAWKDLRAQLLRYAAILKPFLSRRPPELGGASLGDMAALGQAGLAIKRLGREDMRDFLRVLLMNVYDLLDEQLATTG